MARNFREAKPMVASCVVDILSPGVFKFSDALSGLTWASVLGAMMD